MGESSSKSVNPIAENPLPEAQLPELLEKPWRKYADLNGIDWTKENADRLKNDISKCEEKINLLFVGQVQSGKSSTINSLISIQENGISERTKAGTADDSLTDQFIVIQGEGMLENIKFCDIIGLELGTNRGLQNKEITNASSGSLKPGEDLKNVKSYELCRANDTRKIHCLVYIVDGENVTKGMSTEFKRRLADIEKTMKIGPNRVVFVTKIDKICPKVKEDIRNIFYSRKVFEAVENASKLVGVPKNKVFPVHNYTDEVEVDPFTNVPLLLALKAAIKMGADYIKGQKIDNKADPETDKKSNDPKMDDKSNDQKMDNNLNDQKMENKSNDPKMDNKSK